MPLVFKILKTFFLAKTKHCYYCIHTSILPCPQTHTPPCGSRAAPPPRPSCQYPPPLPADPPPRPNSPPPQVLADSWGGGCRIRTGCVRPPRGHGHLGDEFGTVLVLDVSGLGSSDKTSNLRIYEAQELPMWGSPPFIGKM